MREQIETYKLLVGKSGENGSWLPVWIHAQDTANVLKYLLRDWCSNHEKQLICHDAGIDEEQLEHLVTALGLLHDIGKMTPIFQQKILKHMPEKAHLLATEGFFTDKTYIFAEKSPHGIAGEAILREGGLPYGIASVIGAHHGKPRPKEVRNFSGEGGHIDMFRDNFYGIEYRCNCTNSPWHRARLEWLQYTMNVCEVENCSNLPNLGIESQMILCGLLITADWIASNTHYFPLIPEDDPGLEIDLDVRMRCAEVRLQFPANWASERYFYLEEAFRESFGFVPNETQKEVLEIVNSASDLGVLVLEAPMGCGKTEAALAAAEVLAARKECGGIFYGLPTQATANGIFPRLLEWAKQQAGEFPLAVRLAHGMAALNEDYRSLFAGESKVGGFGEEDTGNLVVHEFFSGRKQALLPAVCIGTVDQSLMAALKQKHVFLRHLGLAGKVVIIDECHAYDAYMTVYLKALLRWLGKYRVPVILLSATLPSSLRGSLIDAYNDTLSQPDEVWKVSRGYPIITYTDGKKVCQRVIKTNTKQKEVRIVRICTEDVPDFLAKNLHDGCAGIIMNTVRRAQEMEEALKKTIPDAQITLLHSHFIAKDRAEIEREVLKNIGKRSTNSTRKRQIIIGTQVLEQSLDIDCDILFTDLCPMDLLLQRIGRLQRHPRKDRPKAFEKPVCYVLGAEENVLEKGSQAVYGTWLLLRTKKILPELIYLPGDIQNLVQETYRDPDTMTADERIAFDEYKLHISSKEQHAKAFLLNPPKQSRRILPELTGLLDADVPDLEKQGERSVRDASYSIQVILMMRDDEGNISFLPWSYGGKRVASDRVPSDDEARMIASQRITLPHILMLGKNGDCVINDLEDKNRYELPEWQKSPWLRGELILLMDKNLRAELPGYQIQYTRKEGLTYDKRSKPGSCNEGQYEIQPVG